MKKIDMSNVKEASTSKRVTAGVYICRITKVEDYPDREYLKVFYDIIEGEFAGYYEKTRSEHPDWLWMGAYVKSYKPTALPMFKRFCSAVSKSNAGFVFDGNINSDERTLVGKKIGLVLGEEEYYANDGNKRTRTYVAREFPVDQADSQKVPELKALIEETTTTNTFTSLDDVVVPFS